LKQADEPSRRRIVFSWGEALREIHRWQPSLTFRESPLESLEIIKQNTKPDEIIERGPFKGWSARAIVAELERAKDHIQPTMTFTHWDYCVPNALVQGEKVNGVVDWGTGRYADYRLDLAAASWSLEYNLVSRDYLPSLLEGYGYGGTLEELRWFEGLWMLPV
jgi:aminoglycoside phosphotransferase